MLRTIQRVGKDGDKKSRHARRSWNGFTVIELLAVMVIIMIFAGVIMGIVRYVRIRTLALRARAEITALTLAIEAFKNDTGHYPTSGVFRISTNNWELSTGYSTMTAVTNSWLLYTQLSGSKQYIRFTTNQLATFWLAGGSPITYIVDPFGAPYNYYNPGFPTNAQMNQATYDLWSYGPDGMNGTVDDITNWKR